jgi:glutamate/aspartate transport system substrate-binding protein
MKRRLLALSIAAAWAWQVLAGSAWAQDSAALSGTLAKIRATGTVVLGVRDAALPFSYTLPNGAPAGYAVELCRDLVEDISAELDNRPIGIVYKAVTAQDRIDRVVSGDVDIECGSTTRNIERQQHVAFSPVFFVAGTKLLVPRESPIHSYRDLAGKTIVVTSGTTNETALQALAHRRLLQARIVTAPSHGESFAILRAGKADAFATDDVLLAGLAATRDGAAYHIVGEYLSYEPYGLMYRRNDPAFAAIIEHGFKRMAETGRLSELYERWLVRRLPTGETLNIPMSVELAEMFRVLGQPD